MYHIVHQQVTLKGTLKIIQLLIDKRLNVR